jgi:hypothetical protein
VLWVLDHQADLRADFRALYRITPAEALELDFPEYLELAVRTPNYQGSVRVKAEAQAEAERRTRPRRGVRQVDGTKEAVLADPLLREAISFS